jgi:hypothetical protein
MRPKNIGQVGVMTNKLKSINFLIIITSIIRYLFSTFAPERRGSTLDLIH